MSKHTSNCGLVAGGLGLFLLVEGLWIAGISALRHAMLDIPAEKIVASLAFLIVGASLFVFGTFTNWEKGRSLQRKPAIARSLTPGPRQWAHLMP